MKIGIAGKSTKKKKSLVKEIAGCLGLNKAPDPTVAVKEWKPGGGPLSVLKGDADKCYYCATDMIGRLQTNDMLKDDFVTGTVYTDIYTMFAPLASGDYVEMLGDLEKLCMTNLSYYDAVFVMPGETLEVMPEMQDKIRIINLKGEDVKDMATQIKTAMEN